jgi:hypothetical protein
MRVRFPSPAPCAVAGHRSQVSRDIVHVPSSASRGATAARQRPRWPPRRLGKRQHVQPPLKADRPALLVAPAVPETELAQPPPGPLAVTLHIGPGPAQIPHASSTSLGSSSNGSASGSQPEPRPSAPHGFSSQLGAGQEDAVFGQLCLEERLAILLLDVGGVNFAFVLKLVTADVDAVRV